MSKVVDVILFGDCSIFRQILAHCIYGVYRHQLLADDDLGSLYDLLIDDPPEIRHAIGSLVYDHLIAQKFNSSQPSQRGLQSFKFYILLECCVYHVIHEYSYFFYSS